MGFSLVFTAILCLTVFYVLPSEALAKVLKQANLSFRVKGEIFYNQLDIRFLTFVRNDNL